MHSDRAAAPIEILRVLGTVCLLSALGACGGGSSSSALPTSQSVVLQPEAPVSIFFSGGFFSSTAGYPFQIGDDSTDLQALAVLQFDLSSIPDGALITSASLKIHRTDTIGSPSNLAPILSDHIDWPLGAAVTVQHAVGQTLTSAFGSIDFSGLQQLGVPVVGRLGVTAQVADDMSANRTTSAFRLRGTFATNANSTLDLWYFGGLFSSNGLLYEADLAISYTAP